MTLLRLRRKARRWTVHHLAAISGIEAQRIYWIEHGAAYAAGELDTLAAALKLSLAPLEALTTTQAWGTLADAAPTVVRTT